MLAGNRSKNRVVGASYEISSTIVLDQILQFTTDWQICSFLTEKINFKNETAFLVAKRKALLQNILADTEMKKGQTAASQAQAIAFQKMKDAHIVFQDNQLLQRRLIQAKLEKAGLSSALPERPSENDLPQHSRNASEVCTLYSLQYFEITESNELQYNRKNKPLLY